MKPVPNVTQAREMSSEVVRAFFMSHSLLGSLFIISQVFGEAIYNVCTMPLI